MAAKKVSQKKTKQPKLSLDQKKKQLGQLLDARKMGLGTLHSAHRNQQEATKGVLLIDDAILNLLLEDSPLKKQS